MPRRIRSRIVVVISLALLHGFWICAQVGAEPGVVVTRDGSTIEGDVSEVGDEIHVNIHGVTTVIPKSRVAEVRYQGDYDAEFHQRLAKIGEEDAAGRVALARE